MIKNHSTHTIHVIHTVSPRPVAVQVEPLLKAGDYHEHTAESKYPVTAYVTRAWEKAIPQGLLIHPCKESLLP